MEDTDNKSDQEEAENNKETFEVEKKCSKIDQVNSARETQVNSGTDRNYSSYYIVSQVIKAWYKKIWQSKREPFFTLLYIFIHHIRVSLVSSMHSTHQGVQYYQLKLFFNLDTKIKSNSMPDDKINSNSDVSSQSKPSVYVQIERSEDIQVVNFWQKLMGDNKFVYTTIFYFFDKSFFDCNIWLKYICVWHILVWTEIIIWKITYFDSFSLV